MHGVTTQPPTGVVLGSDRFAGLVRWAGRLIRLRRRAIVSPGVAGLFGLILLQQAAVFVGVGSLHGVKIGIKMGLSSGQY